MLKISYKPSFIREWKKLPKDFQQEIYEKIEELKNKENHLRLKVHKLHGQLQYRYSFSIDYRTRIVFEYLDNSTIVLLAIGDHDLYQ